MSYRKIAAEIGVAVAQVQKYLREPLKDPGVLPLSPTLTWDNAENVRKVQGVWPDALLHFPDKGEYTSAPGDLWETDDEPACICGWVLNARHITSGLIKIWPRSPELEGKNKTRMLWRCPVHNPILAENQSTRTSRVAPPSIYCYRWYEYGPADSARRAAHRQVKAGNDGSYILVSRVIGKAKCWDMASATNLTRRKSSWKRAGTVEADKEAVVPLLREKLSHLPTLRKVAPKHLWRASDDEEYDEREDKEVRYEVLASGTRRTISHVSEKVIGRHIDHNDYVSPEEWASLTAYIARDKGTDALQSRTSKSSEHINFSQFGSEE